MTRELHSTLPACRIEQPALIIHIPCMEHVIHLSLGAFMNSLGVNGHTKSWAAHQRDYQFGENGIIDIGKSQSLRKEGNGRINELSAMRPSLAKIIEKVCISRDFESLETDLHIAESVCCIDYADTWSSKRVHWRSKSQSPHHCTTYDGCEDMLQLDTRVGWAGLWMIRIHLWVATKCNIQWYPDTLHNTGQMDDCLVSHGGLAAYSDVGPCGYWWGIQSHCIASSQSTMTCLIIWMALYEIRLRKRIIWRKICYLPWSIFDRSCPNITLKWLQWRVCFLFQQRSSIISGSCNCLGSRTREWILIVRTRHPMLPNSTRPVWGQW